MNGFLLDTHVWIWAQCRDYTELSDSVFAEIEVWQKSSQLFVSNISVLEIARLSADGMLQLDSTVDTFVQVGTSNNGFQLLPLTPHILIESTRLPGIIHRDPVDRILTSTAREHGLALVTRDKQLREYAKQGHLTIRRV